MVPKRARFFQAKYQEIIFMPSIYEYISYVFGRQVGISRGSVGIHVGRSQVGTDRYKSGLSLHKSGLGLHKSG